MKINWNGKKFESLRDAVGVAIKAYLKCDFGYRLALHSDGDLILQPQNTFRRDEVASVKCWGIGNMDMSEFRDGWDSEGKTDQECIDECCENGDMTRYIDDIVEKVEYSLKENGDRNENE